MTLENRAFVEDVSYFTFLFFLFFFGKLFVDNFSYYGCFGEILTKNQIYIFSILVEEYQLI